MPTQTEDGIYLALISVHGLIRGRNLELGRDSDTGGQTLYVVELARALAQQPSVRQVDLLTRRVVDPDVSDDYAQPIEPLSEGARIVRIECGPEEYIRKEELWDHLNSFADNTLEFFHRQGVTPTLVHSHYADAGYVGQILAHTLGISLIHTGHSLGRVKRRRLLASGLNGKEIEERYNMSRRIEAEESTLSVARRVIASTSNEVHDQYGLYDYHQPDGMCVIPPGTDLERFRPPDGSEVESSIAAELARFLEEPSKPMILAICRPDERKNLVTLIKAYGGSKRLQELANLVIVAGTRRDISEMDDGPARVLVDLLLQIDRSDLYGKVAYPKQHESSDVPILYRLAAAKRGLFINPALTEPFGLTLIEAAASGLPIVATEDGGPREIIANCQNGELIDPLDINMITEVVIETLTNQSEWDAKVSHGLEGVERHYSWEAHARSYLEQLRPILAGARRRPKPKQEQRAMLYHDRALFTDLDQNLLGDPESLAKFCEAMREHRREATFGVATSRSLVSALQVMRVHQMPQPDVLITSGGSQIHYAPEMTPDSAWERHIDHLWTPIAVRSALSELPGLELRERGGATRFRLSYEYDPTTAPTPEQITTLLHQNDQTVHVIRAASDSLDILPIRASKGLALRWFAEQWDVPLERILAAGGSGADEDMLRGNTLAVVVANRQSEALSSLVDVDRIYFAKKPHALGILEAIDHYDFYGSCGVSDPA